MRAIVFSDGHIGVYPEGYTDATTGLNTRLLDTLNVWDWVLETAQAKQADLVIFGGDRFKPHNPPAWMRDLADERMRRFAEAGMPLACLLGNHDQYDKSGRWTSYGGVRVFMSSEVYLFTEPGTLDVTGARFHFLPYGSKDQSLELSKTDPNIVIFHDDVKGVSQYGRMIAQNGLPQEVLDRPEYDLVLGGHVHLRQELPFHHVPAIHIGTPLERIEDGDQGEKGALLIETTSEGAQLEFIRSPFPRITRLDMLWSGEIEETLSSIQATAPPKSILDVTLIHDSVISPQTRKTIATRLREQGFQPIIRLRRHYDMPSMDVIQPSTRRSFFDQLTDYVQQVEPDTAILTYLDALKTTR